MIEFRRETAAQLAAAVGCAPEDIRYRVCIKFSDRSVVYEVFADHDMAVDWVADQFTKFPDGVAEASVVTRNIVDHEDSFASRAFPGGVDEGWQVWLPGGSPEPLTNPEPATVETPPVAPATASSSVPVPEMRTFRDPHGQGRPRMIGCTLCSWQVKSTGRAATDIESRDRLFHQHALEAHQRTGPVS